MSAFDYHRTVIAYHGCDRSVARSVLLDGAKLMPSENEYDWLGHGIYFWEHGPHRAWEWACQMKNRGRIREPAVLGAYAHLGNCFDLMDSANADLLRSAFPEFKDRWNVTGAPLPVNSSVIGEAPGDLLMRRLDCAVINWLLGRLARDGAEFDSVRCAFGEGEPAFPGSKILHRSHLQIAVRNHQAIIGYFKPNVDFSPR